MTCKERMLAAFSCEPVDRVPCAFMIFEALRRQCANHREFVDRQLAMGLDALVDLGAMAWGRQAFQADLPGVPVETGEGVGVRHWREQPADAPYEVLCKEVTTPDGPLTARVSLTPDWAHLTEVPLFDDWLVPRSREFLVKTREDLGALRHLLRPPSARAGEEAAEVAAEARAFADERGLALQAGWGVGLEAGVWLCGLERLMWAAIDEPAFVDELVELVHQWNVARMRPMLDAGVDLFVRRGWYEGTAFWSPDQFRRFALPSLKAEAELAHRAGARFAYIHTVATLPVLRDLIEVGVDVMIGVDPVQGHETDLGAIREATRGRLCLWGGVNGFVTVETGSEQDVRREVREALRLMGPEGLVLSPVDNVKEDSERAWRNVEALLDEWRRLR